MVINNVLKCAKDLIGNSNLKNENIKDYYELFGRGDIFLLMLPPNGEDFGQSFLIEDYFDHGRIVTLSKEHIDKKFIGNFSSFPRVKDDLKKDLLPDFAKDSAVAVDFEGFRILLEKLEAKLGE